VRGTQSKISANAENHSLANNDFVKTKAYKKDPTARIDLLVSASGRYPAMSLANRFATFLENSGY